MIGIQIPPAGHHSSGILSGASVPCSTRMSSLGKSRGRFLGTNMGPLPFHCRAPSCPKSSDQKTAVGIVVIALNMWLPMLSVSENSVCPSLKSPLGIVICVHMPHRESSCMMRLPMGCHVFGCEVFSRTRLARKACACSISSCGKPKPIGTGAWSHALLGGAT